MPDTPSHDDETIAAELAAHPVLADNLVRFDERYLELKGRVREIEHKLERHDLLLARLLELGRGIC
jgi:hypothetical protein